MVREKSADMVYLFSTLAWQLADGPSPPQHQNLSFARRQVSVSKYDQHLYRNRRYVFSLSGWSVPSELHTYSTLRRRRGRESLPETVVRLHCLKPQCPTYPYSNSGIKVISSTCITGLFSHSIILGTRESGSVDFETAQFPR